MVNVSGVPGFNPNIQPNKNNSSAKELMQEAVALIRDILDTTDEGATRGGLMRNMGQVKRNTTESTFQNAPTRRGEYIPLAEAVAGVQKSEDDDDLRLKKKNKNLSKKLKTLLEQLEDIDIEALPPQEKETVKQFLKNAKTILNMQRELELLEAKEELLQKTIDQHKRNSQK